MDQSPPLIAAGANNKVYLIDFGPDTEAEVLDIRIT